jgi:hypothetical protein
MLFINPGKPRDFCFVWRNLVIDESVPEGIVIKLNNG